MSPLVPSSNRRWVSLEATGFQQQEAFDAARAILSDLCRIGPAETVRGSDPFIIVALAEGARIFGNSEFAHQAVTRWRQLLSKLSELPRARIGLFDGFTSVAWLSASCPIFASDWRCDDGIVCRELSEQACAKCDAELVTRLSTWDTSMMSSDLVSGLAGIGVYALARGAGQLRTGILRQILAHLDSAAQRSESLVTWSTPSILLSAKYGVPQDAAAYNLGLAHGVPGILSVLSHMAAAGVEPTVSRSLVGSGARWLLQQRAPEGGFAHWKMPGRTLPEGRSAWCYGNLGVSVGLLKSALVTGDAALEATALELAVREAGRDPRHVGIQDACLCHGASGVALMFHHFHHHSGDARFAEAAALWMRATLGMRNNLGRIGGYQFYEGRRQVADAGFLTGAAGVALALIASCDKDAPWWGSLLAIDTCGAAA